MKAWALHAAHVKFLERVFVDYGNIELSPMPVNGRDSRFWQSVGCHALSEDSMLVIISANVNRNNYS